PAHRTQLRARAGPRHWQPAVLHYLRYSAAAAGISPILFDHCPDGAKGSCRPPGGFAGKPRLWLAFSDDATLWPGRAIVHASAGSVLSTSQGAFERGSDNDQTSNGGTAGFRS